MKISTAALGGLAAVAGVAVHDLTQRKHSLLRTFPLLGHGRYLVETVGPELRQYVVASNDEERPFSRDQRRYIYASAKGENSYFGFGTDNDFDTATNYPVIKHRTFSPVAPASHHGDGSDIDIPCAKVVGRARGREKAFRPASIVNVSAMSFGSLSGAAVRAINEGVRDAGAMHNTGEGGLSEHHRQGADLVWQIGTGYFGCRNDDGSFSLDKLKETVASAPVKMLEIKLSQGAKPGLGGVLPAAKVTSEIAQIRGIPEGEDCISPSRHSAFHDVDSMLDFVEHLAAETGLPVGIKSAVGHQEFWRELAEKMADGTRGVDFITIDGGEGGTGAAPLVFTDSVSLPFRTGFARVYSEFARVGITDRVVFIGSGRLGLPDNAMVAFALGADMINVAREAMLAVGCIQTQRCHTGQCPVGVATQNSWLERGIDVPVKAERVNRYISTLRRDLLKVAQSVGVHHPGLVTVDDVELLAGNGGGDALRDAYHYEDGWGQLGPELEAEIVELMDGQNPEGGTHQERGTAELDDGAGPRVVHA